jgi:sugar lactone lactonase YvrE
VRAGFEPALDAVQAGDADLALDADDAGDATGDATGDARGDATGPTVSTYAGSGVKGSKDGPAATAQFMSIDLMVLDGAGRLIVADATGNNIRMVAGGSVTTVAGEGSGGYLDGAAATARFDTPEGVAVDSAGTIYVADTGNNRIRQLSGGQVTTLAGSGTPGYQDGPAAQARFDSPEGIVVDKAGDVYVADKHNHCIRKIDGGQVSTFAGTNVAGAADGPLAQARFSEPYGLALDGAGRIYVAEATGDTIRLIDGASVTTVAGSTGGFTDGPAAKAQFDGPRGIAVDGAGTIYVADRNNHAVRTVAKGAVQTLAGTGVAGFKDGPAVAALFNYPYGIAVDAAGRVYVADRDNYRIRVIDR